MTYNDYHVYIVKEDAKYGRRAYCLKAFTARSHEEAFNAQRKAAAEAFAAKNPGSWVEERPVKEMFG